MHSGDLGNLDALDEDAAAKLPALTKLKRALYRWASDGPKDTRKNKSKMHEKSRSIQGSLGLHSPDCRSACRVSTRDGDGDMDHDFSAMVFCGSHLFSEQNTTLFSRTETETVRDSFSDYQH